MTVALVAGSFLHFKANMRVLSLVIMTLRTVDFEDIGFVPPSSTSAAQRRCANAISCSNDEEEPQRVLNTGFINGLTSHVLQQPIGVNC